jgi:CPA2 family monovalent cation:H+ antiporter-2
MRAKEINPRVRVVARAHSQAEVEHLLKHGADYVTMGEREIADGMVEFA